MSSFTNSERAEVLTQALPYIKKYSGKTIVVKYGGNAMTDESLKAQVMEDIVLLNLIGINVVLVHGGGPEINEMLEKVGKESEFVNGLRVTDKETVNIVQMVLAGKVNKTLVNMLGNNGGKAVGLCGIDNQLLEAKIKDEKLGYVGEVTKVNSEVISDVLDLGYIPVISTIACDADGNTYNVNADTAAGEIAAALKASRFILMTDIVGVLKDANDENSLIAEMTVSEAKQLCESGAVSGGMIPKIECCVNAIEKGVDNVVIMDGRVPHSILMELLTDEGAGTMITGGK